MNSLKALERYSKLKEGKSLKQIAEEENVTIQTVDRSIRDFSGQRLMDLRAKIERDNSRLRRKIQSELGAKYVDALAKLLDGKREEVHYDSRKGEFVKTEIVDIDLLIKALEAYRRSTSLEEKPTPSSTVVNVQQNNMNEPSESFRFEDRIEYLKAKKRDQITMIRQKEEQARAERRLLQPQRTVEEVGVECDSDPPPNE